MTNKASKAADRSPSNLPKNGDMALTRSRGVFRTPRGYDGLQPTGHQIRDLLPKLLKGLGALVAERGDLVLAAWPEIVGSQLAPMTQAVAFVEGVLQVKVKNSTLLSLLSRQEKGRLIAALRAKFPRTKIENIIFRMG